MWWDFILIDENDEEIVYMYGREAIALDGEIVYNRKTRRWSVTLSCEKDDDNPVLMAESERKFWQVVKAGFPDSYKVVIP
jgi:hypothetical protein